MLGIIEVISGPNRGRHLVAVKDKPQAIGRGVAALLKLTDPTVSGVHCTVYREEDTVWIEDAGSDSGTWVNGNRVTRHPLQAGDRIRLGNTELSFRWSDSDQRETETFVVKSP